MSFLIETISRRMAVAPISRVAVASASRTRTFTTSIAARKSATETVKDGLKTVDRAVSDKIVDGIDAGENAATKAKQTAGDVLGQASSEASKLEGEAAGKASELKGQAKGAAHEAAGKAQGTAEKVKKNL